MNLQWSKDLGRSIDYLETRPDIDTHKLAFFGISFGAAAAPRLVAIETRIKAAILAAGGSWEEVPPSVDQWNFAPRFKVPVLMLNGRDDFSFPLEASQLPLLRQLGHPRKTRSTCCSMEATRAS
jgi:eukaryotic-like serine/threonine-protein kinase